MFQQTDALLLKEETSKVKLVFLVWLIVGTLDVDFYLKRLPLGKRYFSRRRGVQNIF